MGKYLIKGATVGIVLENGNTGIVENTVALDNSAVLGALYSPTNLTYFKLPFALDVVINTFGTEDETLTTLEDEFDHYEAIRKIGGGSVEFPQWIDDTPATDITNIIKAVKDYPHGVTSGSAEEARHSIMEEDASSKANDKSGYAIVVQSRYVNSAGSIKYLHFTFHNTSISGTPSKAPKQTAKYRLEWKDARHIDGPTKSDTTFGNHSNA